MQPYRLDIMHVVPYISINMLHRRFEQMLHRRFEQKLHRLIIMQMHGLDSLHLKQVDITSQTSLTTQG